MAKVRKREQSEEEFLHPVNGDDVPVSVSSDGHLAVATPKLSRDEMNLAEFPLTVLSKRADPSIKTLEFTDFVKGKNGDVVQRKWIITGADKFGLPTSSDDEVLLGLLKLTADHGLQTRKVPFTRYELLKILRWTTEGRSYTRLQNALDRLSGVRIKASNAFYDNETKAHSTRNFGIIDAYEINDGRDTRESFFAWSEVLFKSFQVGFIKKLDLDFYLELQSAVSKRLYRYLDKHFWYRSRMQINLFTLAHEKIGVSRNYVYASSLKQQIQPALEELQNKGILSNFEFVGKGKSTEIVLVAAHAPKKSIAMKAGTDSENARGGSVTAAGKVATRNADVPRQGNSELSDEVAAVQSALIERGIDEKQAWRLVGGQGSATLQRMVAVIEHFDSLLAQKSKLISRSPTGFLYRAVERPFEFMLPGEKRVHNETHQNDESSAQEKRITQKETDKDRTSMSADLEVLYLTARKSRLDEVLKTSTKKEYTTLQGEVEEALNKLRSHISPQRFAEAVQHGVEQRLLEQHGFPDFDLWVKQH